MRWVFCTLIRLNVEVTLIQYDRSIGVFNTDVLVRDVVDSAISDILAGPGLEPRPILG